MNFKLSGYSPKVLSQKLGLRLKQARLNQNITQDEVAQAIGLSRHTVMNAEKGQASLENFIAILQSLNLIEQLDLFLPEQPISPVQLAKLQGSKRHRASRQDKTQQDEVEEW